MTNVDLIKDKLNILDVVGSYVKLEKAGSSYKGRSPFTNEKTPSFFVSPEKGFFYCFSSGKGGDMFTFVQEMERVDFREALKILAEKAGVELSQTALPDSENTHVLYYKILNEATKWYEVQLRKNTKVVEYLMARGLTKETMVAFRLGFALDEWGQCYDYLRSRGYQDKDIQTVGLITRKEGKGNYYDRFRSRIMFPIMDTRGRVIGFSGRIFSDHPADLAKYVNSPEGPLFDKSKILYGFHTAKNEIAKKDFCIIVEGQFDVILSQQAGYLNTVALSGTGLTSEHLKHLRRFTNNLYLALDSDSAGVKATRRSVLAAYHVGMNVRIITLPEGSDPADILVKSQELWDVAIKDAQGYIDYRLELLNRSTAMDFDEKRKIIYEDIFMFVALIQSSIAQDKFLQKIALFLGVSVDAVRNDFASFTPEKEYDSVTESSSEPSSTIQRNPHTYLLSHYAFLKEKEVLFNEEILEEIHRLYQLLYGKNIDDDVKELDEVEKNINFFIFSEQYDEKRHHKDISQFFLQDLYHQRIFDIEKRIQKINESVRQAELRKDFETIKQLLNETQTLSTERINLQANLNQQ